MKRIVRLTETGLTRLVKRIINEQNYDYRDERPYRSYLKNGDENEVSELLSNLPTDTQFLALVNCEYADFNDIDLGELNDLAFINLENTPNNLLKTNGHSFKHDGGSFYVPKKM